jgi:DNA-directed RNA polymerase subunit RPC12/RpoP
MERSTHICKNCAAEVTYWTENPQDPEAIPIVKCPACGAIVPELNGLQMIASFKKKPLEST